jgi:hypothetical protein
MLPTIEQIQRAAYDLWECRGRTHGHDRADWYFAEKDLVLRLNYRTLVEYPLLSTPPLVLGDRETRKCRFCERTADRTHFEPLAPVVPSVLGASSLWSAEICSDCQVHCRNPLNAQLARFWRSIRDHANGQDEAWGPDSGRALPLSVAKALFAMALLIMPQAEIEYFLDGLEWVCNPDTDADAGLFAGITCRARALLAAGERHRASLDIRNDDQAPMPYMLFYLAWDGMLVQLHVPWCTRDQDLDGRSPPLPDNHRRASPVPA